MSGSPWATVGVERTILVVVHTVTAANRLDDVLSVFDSDRRIQLVFSFPDASVIAADVELRLRRDGAIVIPWPRATSTSFDLAISVHHSGNLHAIDAPLVLLSHGMGYTKVRKRETGNGKRETGNVYGLAPEWLLHDGAVTADALVLSHEEQYGRLADATPSALEVAVVAGDPCFDRIRASRPHRTEFRHALGADPASTVVVVSSTWGPESLFGRHPDLIGEILSELTLDDHVVAAILHPNVWFAHGPAQIRRWLADALRAGLRLIPPERGWQQGILAADLVIGDNGAVTGYAAACGIPTMLAAFPDDAVAPGSAIDALGKAAPRLSARDSLRAQFSAAVAGFDSNQFALVTDLVTSVPDESAILLRRLFYQLMRLPEPAAQALVPHLPAADLRPERQPVRAMWVDYAWTGPDEVLLRRWPADVPTRRAREPRTADTHLVAYYDHPQRTLRTNAAIIVVPVSEFDTATENRLATLLHAQPGCAMAVGVRGDECLVRQRNGHRLALRAEQPLPRAADGSLGASAVYGWLADGRSWASLPATITIRVGAAAVRVAISQPADQ